MDIEARAADSSARRIIEFDDYETYFGKRIYPTSRRLAYLGIAFLLAFAAYDWFLPAAKTQFWPRFAVRCLACLFIFLMSTAMHRPRFERRRVPWIIAFGTAGLLTIFFMDIVLAPNLVFIHVVLTYFCFGDFLIAPLLSTRILLYSYAAAIAGTAVLFFIAGFGVSRYLEFCGFALPVFSFLAYAIKRQREDARTLYRLARHDYFHATFDALSLVLNRRSWYDKSAADCRNAERKGGKVSFAILDIDHFKSVNDTYGHHAGDLVIQSVAKILLEQTRSSDVVGRLGGEEFGVLLPDTDADGAREIAERIRRTVANTPVVCDGKEIRVTASLGVVACSDEPMELDALVRLGDQRLYEAKTGGRDRVVWE